MDNAVIVYESMFGGRAASRKRWPPAWCGLPDARSSRSGKAPTVIGADVDLFVVGAPTCLRDVHSPQPARGAEGDDPAGHLP